MLGRALFAVFFISMLVQPYGELLSSSDSTYPFLKVQSANLITRIEWSPNGDILAMYNSQRGLCLYNGQTFEALHPQADSLNSIHLVSMVFSNDHILVTGHEDGTIQQWDVSGEQLDVLQAHQGEIQALSVSSDGSLIASGTLDSDLVRIWEHETQELLTEIDYRSRGVVFMVFSPDNQQLAYSGIEPAVVLWSRQGDWLELLRMPPPRLIGDWIGRSVFIADGEFLMAVTTRGLSVWSTKTREYFLLNRDYFDDFSTIFYESFRNISSNVDGSMVALTSLDTVYIYDVAVQDDQVRLSRRTSFPNREGSGIPIALHPSGTTVAYGYTEVRLWNIETHEEISYEWCR